MSQHQNRSFIGIGNLLSGILVCTFTVALIGFASLPPCSAETGAAFSTGDAPALNISPAVVEYKPKVKVLISGSGFRPDTAIGIRIYMDGAVTNIAYLIKPAPKTNELGAFAGIWTLNREISKKILKPLPMIYTIVAVDENAKQIASAPLMLCDPKAEKKSPMCEFLK